uniref:Uncharacterized protein n=1 Tax=Arundo donax TaxID=35708 RepID=A0A0A9B217_ARUDO
MLVPLVVFSTPFIFEHY